MKTLLAARLLFLVTSGFVFILTGFSSYPAFAFSDLLDPDNNRELPAKESFLLAQHGGPPEGRGPRHGGRGQHCSEMGSDEGCAREMRDCPGGMGGCRAEEGWVIGEAWDAGCIMAADKADQRNARNLGQLQKRRKNFITAPILCKILRTLLSKDDCCFN